MARVYDVARLKGLSRAVGFNFYSETKDQKWHQRLHAAFPLGSLFSSLCPRATCKREGGGTWGARSVEHPTLSFGSRRDLGVVRSGPMSGSTLAHESR